MRLKRGDERTISLSARRIGKIDEVQNLSEHHQAPGRRMTY